eukprot:scaffold47462_cov61-Cyclotella_meneghiniana.AAC.2
MKRVLSSSLKGVAMKSSDWETSDIISTGNNNNNNNQPNTSGQQLQSRSNSDASRRMSIHSSNSLFKQPDLLISCKTADAAATTGRKASRTSSVLTTLDADEQDPVDESNTASLRRNSKRTYDEDDAEVIIVNTFREKKSKQLDAPRHLSSADLDTLKANDPFMYYSIPSVKRAVWEGREVDFDVDLGRPVKRCSAVSFENVNDFAVGLSYDDTRSVANENGDRKEDLFLSFFGVDCQ